MAGKARSILKDSSNVILWAAGLFFLVGGLTFFDKSWIAAVLMLLLAVVLIPPVWRKIKVLQPKVFKPSTRLILILVLFFGAVYTSPSATSTAEVTKPATVASVKKAEPQKQQPSTTKPIDQIENVAISFDNGNYVAAVTGKASTDYTLEFAGGDKAKVTTDKEGETTVKLPSSAGTFGVVQLVRDTNGAFPGGKKTVKKGYYYLNRTSTVYRGYHLGLVISSVAGSSSYSINGYYLPGAKILVKSGDTVLAEANANSNGKFELANIKVSTNFTKVSLYEEVSDGWLNTKQNLLLKDRYLDTSAHKLVSVLPVYTKEESKTEPVSYGSETVESNTLNKGDSQVTQKGVNGEKTIIYAVTYRGNDEISRTVRSESITKQPVNQVTTVGTYVYTAPAPQVNSSGATALCSDGSLSYSAHHQGTCSHHGGVAVWYR